MLNRHRAVYIKPINGSRGAGIIKVSKRNKYYAVKTNDHQAENPYFSGRCLEGHTGSPPGRQLIIQQAIRVSGKPHFDSRLLIQKDRRQYLVSNRYRRSHWSKFQNNHQSATGGQAVSLSQIPSSRGFSGQQTAAIKEEMEMAGSCRLLECLSRRIPLLGELGLDFYCRQPGQSVVFWKPTPNRPGFFGQIDKNLRHLTILKPMEYACYLAGFFSFIIGHKKGQDPERPS